MKSFKSILEQTKVVNKKKIGGISVSVSKKGSKYEAQVDGDSLDTFDSEADAWNSIHTFMKNYKGS